MSGKTHVFNVLHPTRKCRKCRKPLKLRLVEQKPTLDRCYKCFSADEKKRRNPKD